MCEEGVRNAAVISIDTLENEYWNSFIYSVSILIAILDNIVYTLSNAHCKVCRFLRFNRDQFNSISSVYNFVIIITY